MKKFTAKILLFVGTTVFLSGCSAVRRVPENAKLLTNSSIITNNKLILDEAINSFIIQRPNQKILGMPLSLHFYNMGNPKLETAYQNWLKNPDKTKKPISKFRHGIGNWFLKNGNAPVIINDKKTKKTANSLKQYYFNQGYFDTEVTIQKDTIGKKRAAIKYLVNTHKSYSIATIRTEINSPFLDSIYNKNSLNSFVKSGAVFKADNFEKEEARLISLFKNSGVVHFAKNIVKFDIDTSNVTHTASVILKIPNRVITDVNGNPKFIPFVPQRVKKINVITDYNFSRKNDIIRDSVSYKNINFYAFTKLKFNPKLLADAVAITPNGFFKETERNKTRLYFNNLKNFNVALTYLENNDNTLTANVFLNPIKKYSFGIDTEITHSNVKPFGLTSKLSFTNHNIFKGGENLELSFQGSFLNSAKDASTNSNFFDAYEYGVGLSLSIPRILFPFNIKKIIPRNMQPFTLMKIGTSLQKNIGLDRQNVTGILKYSWQSTSKISHNLEMLNVQYIRNFNTGNYFNIFNSEYDKLNTVSQIFNGSTLSQADSDILQFVTTVLADTGFKTSNPTDYLAVQNVNERRSILIENILVPAIGYTFTYQNKTDFLDNDFSYLRANIVESGLLFSTFGKKKVGETQKKLFSLPVAQFIKTQIEYKKYWSKNAKNTLVFRSFVGLALAYGNSITIPFSRSYFAGGSNEIRAWKAYDLGPGSTQSNLEFNVGNFKIVSNLEYRFKILNSFNGALFIDAGNIWNITNNTFVEENTKFKGFNSFKDIAVGSGFGVRYDFNFLVFRFDIGFKTYEPYLINQQKWFTNFNFANAVYNIGINYPF